MHSIKLVLTFAGALDAVVGAVPIEALPSSPAHVSNPATQCGQFLKIEEEGAMPVYANGHYENLEVATHMIAFDNWSCGICMVFQGRDATGDIMWSGGPGAHVGPEVRGGQSYYCIYGQDPAASINATNIRKGVEARKASTSVNTADNTVALQTCGNYGAIPPNESEDIFTVYANNHSENTERNSIMTWFTNWGCGFCIVFKERDVQGDILWSGGPGPFTEAAKGGQSYYCY